MQLKWNESKSEEKSTILPLGGKGKQNGQQFLKLLKTVQKHPYDQNNRLSSFLSIKLPFSQIVFSLNIILYSVLSIMLGDDDIKMKSLILIPKQFEEPVRDIANINNTQLALGTGERYLTLLERIKENIFEDSNARTPWGLSMRQRKSWGE